MQTRKKLTLFDSLNTRSRHLCGAIPVGMLLASVAYAQNNSTSLSAANGAAAVIYPNPDWIHFPPRSGKSLPSVSPTTDNASDAASQTKLSTAAPSTSTPEDKTPPKVSKTSNGTPSVASNNEWVQFPPLPAPKPKATASPDKKTADKPVTANSKAAETSNNAQAPEASPALNNPPTPNNTEFKFKQFNFQGNTVYSEAALRKLLAVTVPAVKDVNDLQRAAEVVANHYQDDGVLARVDLLPQDLTEGVVTMTITEGRFGGAKMETPESPKLPHDFLVKLVETAQPKDTAVRVPQMDRATLLLKEIPGVEASVRLSTGEVDGETRALVQVKDKKAYDGQFAVDNTGSTYTGAYRFSTQYNRYGLLGRADATNVQYMHSEGLDYLRLGYSEP